MSRIIKIFDTTLRDGEQSPGCSMNKQEKIEVAAQLEKLGVDIIEAGFAIASKGDFESIVAISEAVSKPTVCSLCRTVDIDIKAAAESLHKAKNKRIHTFIATSDIHMKHKLKMTPNQVLDRAVESIKLAKSFVEDIEFSCEDAGRSDREFLAQVYSEAIKAGATVLNVPDTVGYMTPDEYGALIAYLMANVPGIEGVDVSVHCHNDLGVATANSMAGVVKGASQIECTINGIGERAGNTALEEVVMGIHTRSDFYNCTTTINTKEIVRTSKMVSSITGSVVQPNKAIVGANAFAHEAGIHQHGMLQSKSTYEIMDAESVGLKDTTLVLGKHSGRHAFKDKLSEMGITLSDSELQKAFERFKTLADRKKELTDADLESIVSDQLRSVPTTYELKYVQIVAGNTTRNTACVQLEKAGELIEKVDLGAGPVDALFKTIDQAINEDIDLVDFSVHAVTEGTDALGEVTVRIRDKGRMFMGRGAELDVLVAAAKAYVEAINRMLYFRGQDREKPTDSPQPNVP